MDRFYGLKDYIYPPPIGERSTGERLRTAILNGAFFGGTLTSVYMYLKDIPKPRLNESKLVFGGRVSAMVGFGAFSMASALGIAVGLKDELNTYIAGDYRIKTMWGSLLSGLAGGLYVAALCTS